MQGQELFDRVLSMTGFSVIVGPGALRRALRDSGGATMESARVSDYRKALPRLRTRMEIYMPRSEAIARIRRIEDFLGHLDAHPDTADVDDGGDWDDESEFGKRKFGRTIQILQEVRERLRDAKRGSQRPAPATSAPAIDALGKAPASEERERSRPPPSTPVKQNKR